MNTSPPPMQPDSLEAVLPEGPVDADTLLDLFTNWVNDRGLSLYPAQEEAILEIYSDQHVVLNTPTGSGKSLVALAMHFYALATNGKSYYTSPIKALVSEKFFELCRSLGPTNVGMMTGDATVNPRAQVICCTAEILASLALREGDGAQVSHAVLDEFHYYGDRDRGAAWQLPLLQMNKTQFLLMSATLGDPAPIAERLTSDSGRHTAVVRSSQRPVPLEYRYSTTPLIETITDLTNAHLSPVYVVHFAQRECGELAQSLTSTNFCSKEEKRAISDAMKGTAFDTPYGKVLRKYLAAGIAVHHAGLLPKYRTLVETLSQKGLLKVICGTDTLGVGINVPIRTVLFTRLCKYDGQKTRLLSIRGFKQIAGRAGRKGFDDQGLVVCQAPAHIIENLKLAAKVGNDPKRRKKMVRKKPPERGYVAWNEETFQRMSENASETLTSRFNIDHGMLVNLLQAHPRGGGYGALISLITRSHQNRGSKKRLRRKAKFLFKTLRDARILEVREKKMSRGASEHIAEELQDDFSIHHSLSLFLISAVGRLPPDDPEFHLKAITLTEAILEDPTVVLLRQQDKLRSAAYAQMKAEGVEYDERQDRLEKITWPMPDKEMVFEAFDIYAEGRPWLQASDLKPKGVVRTMFETYASFGQFVKEFGLERSEGVLLRHLTQTYKALRKNIPELLWTDGFHDALAYLRETITRADGSLLAAWKAMQTGRPESLPVNDSPSPARLEEDPRALHARIRAELRTVVSNLAQGKYAEAVAALCPAATAPWDEDQLEASLMPFFEAHERLIFDHAARAVSLCRIEKVSPSQYTVVQVLCDDAEDNDWFIRGRIDLRNTPNPDGPIVIIEEIGR